MKAIKYIVVVFLFISVSLARELVRSSASRATLVYENCSPTCNVLDLDVGASDVKKSDLLNSGKEDQQKKYNVQRQRGVRRRKVRRKYQKGRKGRTGQGLRRQDFGNEGGQKLHNQQADAYQKQNKEGAAKNRYATFDEAQVHKSENQKQSYYKTFFRDLSKGNNKFYDIYDEGGYHKKGGEAYTSYNDVDYDSKVKKHKHRVDEGSGHSTKSDYDKLKAISENIAYGGKKGSDDFFTHINKYGNEKGKGTSKKHEYSDGVLE